MFRLKERLDTSPLWLVYNSHVLAETATLAKREKKETHPPHFFPQPSQHLLVLSLIKKKNPLRFIITDLHSNSVHIKQLLQRVGGLMNAAVSSVLTQFFLIHIQSCGPSHTFPRDPPALGDGNSVSAEMLPPASPQIPEPSPLIQLIRAIDMQPA